MRTISTEDKRGEVVSRLIGFVGDFSKVHGPVPMRVLSTQFAKTMNGCGGFSVIMDELRRDGSIQVLISRTGSRLVVPGDASGLKIPDGFMILNQG